MPQGDILNNQIFAGLGGYLAETANDAALWKAPMQTRRRSPSASSAPARRSQQLIQKMSNDAGEVLLKSRLIS